MVKLVVILVFGQEEKGKTIRVVRQNQILYKKIIIQGNRKQTDACNGLK